MCCDHCKHKKYRIATAKILIDRTQDKVLHDDKNKGESCVRVLFILVFSSSINPMMEIWKNIIKCDNKCFIKVGKEI